jgi:hypothetical protein
MSIARITLRGHAMPMDVLALSDGGLALHPSIGAGKGEFTITHVPTGLALASHITWAQALDALAALAERGFDFSFTDKAGVMPIADDVKAVLKAAGVLVDWRDRLADAYIGERKERQVG